MLEPVKTVRFYPRPLSSLIRWETRTGLKVFRRYQTHVAYCNETIRELMLRWASNITKDSEFLVSSRSQLLAEQDLYRFSELSFEPRSCSELRVL